MIKYYFLIGFDENMINLLLLMKIVEKGLISVD